MKFALGVKVVKAFEDLAQNYCYVMFFKRASFHEIECRSTTKILHYYPQHRVLHASTKTHVPDWSDCTIHVSSDHAAGEDRFYQLVSRQQATS